MVRLIKLTFEYEDGSMDIIDDPRDATLFQSRCNSAGILSGMESFILHKTADMVKKEEEKK